MPVVPTILFCPNCSRALPHQYPDCPYASCSCGKTVERRGEGVLIWNEISTLEWDADAIQPGTSGNWMGKSFVVTGRVRIWYQESVMNYWTLRTSAGATLLLREGYGCWMILMPATLPDYVTQSHDPDFVMNQTTIVIDQKRFLLEDVDHAKKIEAAGEWWLPGIPEKWSCYDFTSGTRERLLIIKIDKRNFHAFNGSVVEHSDLKLANLQDVHHTVFSFNCIDCREKIEIKTYPYARNAACSQCGAYYRLNDAGVFLRCGSRKQVVQPTIAIGSVGVLDGVSYQVVGFTEKEEINIYKSKWREYSLYHPESGFATLSEFDGHWILVKEQWHSPKLYFSSAQKLDFENEPFVLFNEYRYDVNTAMGEFPYALFGDSPKVKEFISPPEIWIQESDGRSGSQWYRGKHMEPAQVRKAFDAVRDFPRRVGVGAVQPKGYIGFGKLMVLGLIGLFCLFTIHWVSSFSNSNRRLFETNFFFNDSIPNQTLVVDRFTLEKRQSNIELTIDAPVNNSWVEADFTLVNSTTGKEYSLEQGVEYYYGYDGGESWTEGCRSETAFFTGIPAGNYVMQIQGARPGSYGVDHFSVTADYDTNQYRNLVACLLILLAWLIGRFFYSNYNEKQRWYNSPFAQTDED